MKYSDRLNHEKAITEAVYYYASKTTSSSTAVGTPIAVDGQTGRAIVAVADGVARYQSIASSNQLGTTSAAYSGRFADGRSG